METALLSAAPERMHLLLQPSSRRRERRLSKPLHLLGDPSRLFGMAIWPYKNMLVGRFHTFPGDKLASLRLSGNTPVEKQVGKKFIVSSFDFRMLCVNTPGNYTMKKLPVDICQGKFLTILNELGIETNLALRREIQMEF